MAKFSNYLISFFSLALLFLIGFFVVPNVIMYLTSQSQSPEQPKEYAIVLGASVHGDELSGALRTRMEMAIELYQKKLVKNILLSGDGTDPNYNETYAMKKFALKHQIPEDVLITDEKGYNTYATMLRAKEVFNTKSAYIISQKFHLIRAVWLARKIGIDADGVSAGDSKDYYYYYDVREFLARSKDFFQVLFRIPPDEDRKIL